MQSVVLLRLIECQYRKTMSISLYSHSQNKSRSILNSDGPKIDPCVTPRSKLGLLLKLFLILVRCVRLLKWEKMILVDKGGTPYQSI